MDGGQFNLYNALNKKQQWVASERNEKMSSHNSQTEPEGFFQNI